MLRYPGVFDDPRHTQVAVVDAESGAIKLLTEELDRNCGTYPNLREPIWDGDDLVFIAEDRGNVHLYRVAADGSGEPRLVVGGERVVTGYDVVAGRLAFAASETDDAAGAVRRRARAEAAGRLCLPAASPTSATPSPPAASSSPPSASRRPRRTAPRSRPGS